VRYYLTLSLIMQFTRTPRAVLKTLSQQEYDAMTEGGKVVEQDEIGPRVIFLSDGGVLKIFRAKPFFSSATLLPYPVRFARNAEKLHSRNVPTVKIIAVVKIGHLDVMAVHYEPIPGETLRSFGDGASPVSEEIITRFAKFVAGLHDQGTYFRSFHLANVIVNDALEMGLIDIGDLWTKNRPLTYKERYRNFSRIYRYADDIELLQVAGRTLFIDRYLEATNAKESDQWRAALQAQQDDFLMTRRRTTD
jgi:hypothetical protein